MAFKTLDWPTLNSVKTPSVVILPIFPAYVNHRAPSGPAAMPSSCWLGTGTTYSLITPAVVIRPILLTLGSTNQRALSGPDVMPLSPIKEAGKGYSVMAPDVLIRPILSPPYSANHNAPSEPAVMCDGLLFGVGTVNSVKEGGVCADNMAA